MKQSSNYKPSRHSCNHIPSPKHQYATVFDVVLTVHRH